MEKPDCFGKWWEAVPGPDGDNCRRCCISDECLVEFSRIRLPEAQLKCVGPNQLTALSEYLEVSEQAILMAMAHKDKPKPVQTPVLAENIEKSDDQEEIPKRSWSWGDHTHEARWNKEREKNPQIAKLTPGTRIEKTYKGKTLTATVKKGGYVYDGQTYPTLSTLTKHIVGPGRNASRFWRLHTL